MATLVATRGCGKFMKFASVRELKNKTSEILRTADKEEVIITSRGKPIVFIQHITEEDIADYIFYSTPSIKKRIEKRWDNYIKNGKTIPVENIEKAVNRKSGKI